jgi:shikimate kinase
MRPDERTLALVGMRCAGKTTVGRLAAGLLGLPFLDHDQRTLLAARYAGWPASSPGELLERAGLAVYRDLEALALRAILEPGVRIVLATGGGCVEREDSRAWLQRAAFVVWLRVEPAVLRARMQADPVLRPALTGGDPLEEVEALLAERAPWYQELAHLTLDGAQAPDALAREIAARVGDPSSAAG